MTRLRTAAFATVVSMSALVALAAPASAHVSVASADATRGGYAVVTFRVPNEEANANTTKLQVQLPTATPIAYAAVQPIPGWTSTLTKTKLAKPVTTDDGQLTEGVSQLTWTASASAAVRPGQFQQFNVQMGPLPEADGVTFKAIQTYSNGEVVRWIETPAPGSSEEPEHPAPVLQLAAASGEDHHSSGDSSDATVSATAAPAADSDDHDGSSNTGPVVLSVIALVLAAGALGLGVVNRARRSS